MRVGRGASDLTPEPGTPMAGYYSTRLSTGMHDPLLAKAIVIESGGVKAALVSCDLIALHAELIDAARAAAEKATGIPARHIMIGATHSHTGPVIAGRGARDARYGGDLPILKGYMERLPGRIAESVVKANADLQPARVSAATGREETIAFNRRFHMKDGSVGWNPGKKNPNIVKTAGPVDPSVPVVYFESENGRRPLATYVNFAMHLDTVGGLEFSADYPFTLARVLAEARGKEMLALFSIGTAGNINHIDVSTARVQKGHEEAQRLGEALGAAVKRTYDSLRPVEGALRARSEEILLDPAAHRPERVAWAESVDAKVQAGDKVAFLDTVEAYRVLDVAARQGKPYRASVQVIALGRDVAWVALPGEVFVELGLAIKRASPFKHTIVVELAHGPSTYIPNEPAFAQGNYEVVSSRVAKGSGERLVELASKILREMAR